MERRTFLKRAGLAGAVGASGLAGCVGAPASSGPKTLVVATYDPFVNAPSSSPGAWLKRRFEEEHDAELVWQTPSSEINYYIQRANQGVEIDADVYVGLNVDMLIRLDQKLKEGSLFAQVDDLANAGNIKDGLRFDPKGRAVPYDTGYISLVWNATAEGGSFQAPGTFDGLLKDRYRGDLLAQSPASSATGRAFFLHTVKAKGRDGFLDYWQGLQNNDVRVLGSWSDAYAAYSEGEAPMVVSYSTDQVYAARSEDSNMQRHQIRFLNDQGYANPEGMARFANTDAPDLARNFMEFVLRPEIQAGIALRNVQFPAVTNAEFPEDAQDYQKYAKVPPEAVTFTYEELKGNLSGWISSWEEQFAGQ